MMQVEGVSGTAAGVPYVAFPPKNPTESSPLVVVWHMMDPPRTEQAMAAALPLDGVDAWRVYVALPLFSSRTPAGGEDEVFALAAEDAVMKFYGPVLDQAIGEFPAALKELRTQLSIIAESPLALVGGSAGGAVVLGIIAGREVPVAAASVINPLSDLKRFIGLSARRYNTPYNWTDKSTAIANRYVFPARADEIAESVTQPAIQFILGELDDEAFSDPTTELYRQLRGKYDAPEHVALVNVTGMEHALAEEPGVEPAPQTPAAAQADAAATDWLRMHLRFAAGV